MNEIVSKAFRKALNESDWNYHIGNNVDVENAYHSDTRASMNDGNGNGRDTGLFGSGTYFSTYRYGGCTSDLRQYNSVMSYCPELVMINDGLYRVDLDLYRNMYRVKSKKEGDVLYTLLYNLDKMCSNVSKGIYDNSIYYQKALMNGKALGLKVPSYIGLVRMMQSYAGDRSDIRSFSTVFMEYNGYNGVNVSGVPYYDSTTHGSVVYDLRKISDVAVPVKKNIGYSVYKKDELTNTLASGDIDTSPYFNSLVGEKILGDMSDMSYSECMRILKNLLGNGIILNGKELSSIGNERVVKNYLRLLYTKKFSTKFDNFCDIVNTYGFSDIIVEYGLYYWLDYHDSDGNTLLYKFLDKFDFDNDLYLDNIPDDVKIRKMNAYLNRIRTAIGRDFDDREKKTIEYFKRGY